MAANGVPSPVDAAPSPRIRPKNTRRGRRVYDDPVASHAPIPWYGLNCYLGLHVDFHAKAKDTELGGGADPEVLVEQLRRMDVDYVQIDSKGDPGYTSYFAKTPGAQVCPGLKGDLVKAWRTATRRLGLPLHAHWNAMGNGLAGKLYPDWMLVDESGVKDAKRLCYRSPYADEVMIPQLLELVGDWGLDGLWIDAEAWFMKPCWCPRCVAAWHASGEADAPPKAPGEAAWSRWVMFHRRGFDDHVNHYADAVHARFPNCRICDNWSLTLSQPGQPRLRVDFISSDDAAVYGVENVRLEARFVSTRGLPWDFMQWLFYGGKQMHDQTVPPSVRPSEHIQQEAATILALGGHHQIYENPSPRRDGGLIDWRVERIAAINQWCRQRQAVCQAALPWEDVAVLNSEHHRERHVTGANLLWSFDHTSLHGAVAACIARHRGVDVVDEWALLPRLDKYALLVIPEQEDVSDELVAAVKAWVARGGRLLLSGAAMPERWGADFLGVEPGEISGPATYRVPVGGGRVPIWSKTWRLVTANEQERRPVRPLALQNSGIPTDFDHGGPPASAAKSGCQRTTRDFGLLSTSDDLERHMTPYQVATLHVVGEGVVAWLPCDAFAFLERSRYALLREFLGKALDVLGGRRELTIKAPLAIEQILRQRGTTRIIHLINRSSGVGTGPNDYAIEQIPPAGPVELSLRLKARPLSVAAAWEAGNLSWTWIPSSEGGIALVRLDRVQIHEAIVIETQEQI